MELITLASSALVLATPYLIKTGEKFAETVGEEIWKFIKKPFEEGEIPADMTSIQSQENFKQELINKLKNDPVLKNDLSTLLEESQQKLASYTQQNINNYGNIEKQVNTGDVSGDIHL